MSEQPEDFVRAAFPPTLKERDAEESHKLAWMVTIAKGMIKIGVPAGAAYFGAMQAVFHTSIFGN